MKKGLKFLAAGVIATTLAMPSGYAFASEVDSTYGSAGVTEGVNYSVEQVLIYAIQDEYMAKAEYEAIIKELEIQRPFSNIVRAEDMHISLLIPLFEKYGVDVPLNDADTRVIVPNTVEEAFNLGIIAEEKNISMYEQFKTEDLPADVLYVVDRLIAGSENHLASFERGTQTSGQGQGTGNVNANGRGNFNGQTNQARGNGMMRNDGNGIGNGGRNLCIVE